MKLFDTHAHITDSKFDAAIEAAGFEKDNIDLCLTVGYDMASSYKAVELAGKFDKVYAAVGVHPHSASSFTKSAGDELIRLAKSSRKVVAIGETGLDYYRNLSPADTQLYAAFKQIDIACEAGLPVIFHIREAYVDMRKLVNNSINKLKNGVLLHCFSGDAKEAAYYTQLERKTGVPFYFSFSGAITYKKSASEDAIKAVPLNRLLIETDCPYLTPEPFRGKLNRPAYVYYVAEKLSKILGKSVEEIAKLTNQNGRTLLKITDFSK